MPGQGRQKCTDEEMRAALDALAEVPHCLRYIDLSARGPGDHGAQRALSSYPLIPESPRWDPSPK